MKKTLGGDRIGSGKKMEVELHNYGRSTHDLSYLWRSTMSAGTLVPFINEVALPGDTFDINLNVNCLTHPTVGPLFGQFKIQLDVYECPIRLYQGQLHNNKLGIGMNMAAIKLPIIELEAPYVSAEPIPVIADLDNSQINPSCVLNYLGIKGVAWNSYSNGVPPRTFNGVPLLGYWDIYKNYYSNKMEGIGVVIHKQLQAYTNLIENFTIETEEVQTTVPYNSGDGNIYIEYGSEITIETTTNIAEPLEYFKGIWLFDNLGNGTPLLSQVEYTGNPSANFYTFANLVHTYVFTFNYYGLKRQDIPENLPPELMTFDLADIDTMRERILAHATENSPFNVNEQNLNPYSALFTNVDGFRSVMVSQEGLGVKTYQSDLFNNWLKTEWIDGENGISAITAVDTSEGNFTIDSLNLAKKVYDMLNRIAVSGGTYDDWLDAVYMNDRFTRAESPIYHGGLSTRLMFQEVVSNAASTDQSANQPLGTLAGKGVIHGKQKGGQVTIRVNEPSYIIGIISLTPLIDYSQGNAWHVHLKTMDDLHKPQLDEIGFQELITEQMAWWDTQQTSDETFTTKSAGKQPAWINYMTNVNKVYGNFAIPNNEQFMVLTRKYTPEWDGLTEGYKIKDLTTYIDPSKFNNMFAQTSLDSQNFWMQVDVNMIARRKISAKLIPNL